MGEVLPKVMSIMTYDASKSYFAGHGADYPATIGTDASIREATSPDDLSLPLYETSFGEAVKRFFRSYAKFSGRASRSEYWWSVLFCLWLNGIPVILFMLGLLLAATSTAPSRSYSPERAAEVSETAVALTTIGGILMIVICLGTIIPLLAVTWRRLHDANFAGPLYFLTFIPNVGAFILLVLMIMPPRPEGQRFDR